MSTGGSGAADSRKSSSLSTQRFGDTTTDWGMHHTFQPPAPRRYGACKGQTTPTGPHPLNSWQRHELPASPISTLAHQSHMV
jgi:hypothetical protein